MLITEAFNVLSSPEGRRDPYPGYAALRAHGPIVRLRPGFYVVTGYDLISRLLRDPRLEVRGWPEGAASRLVGDSMLKANGADHARVRQCARDAFSPRNADRLRGVVTEQAAVLVEYVAHLGRSDEPVDLMDEFAYPLAVRAVSALLGIPVAEQQWFRERAQELTGALEPFRAPGPSTAADRAAGELEEYVTALVRRRRAEPGEDLASALVRAHDREAGALSARELTANLVLLTLAGFETSANLIGNGLGLLLDRPDLAADLREDDGLADRYVEEVLRFDAPLQLTSRWATEPVVLDGIGTVEASSHLLLLLAAGNHDPARFTDPERFDPFRESPPPLSFGAGAHYCLGAALARTEARIALPLLLRRLPGMRRAGEARRRDRLTFRGFSSLPVTCGG
ncbi:MULTISPECIES: cytochrome P450 [Kitasatospora]|uniref:Putative cytochrome P450 n=1 Tax=Kitasatospora setae (strain ATCC 33774 / DSM 43861 / JCM 3304 / KCC A-0304 / NBRC 14216 / KM-6054) TaxID=452652 RepID=E4N312_KITSK|nr:MULTISPECIES: cytochrome P450 [Kitasatospora]BAJ32546.1 putative cytochrome P450 [Kitasatospora setae KM-6054]